MLQGSSSSLLDILQAQSLRHTIQNVSQKLSKFLPRQWRIWRRLSPFPVALGHTSANAVKATVGGWCNGSSACLNFPLHSLMSRARREGSEYHFLSLWYDSAGTRTHDLPVVRQSSTTGPSHRYKQCVLQENTEIRLVIFTKNKKLGTSFNQLSFKGGFALEAFY